MHFLEFSGWVLIGVVWYILYCRQQWSDGVENSADFYGNDFDSNAWNVLEQYMIIWKCIMEMFQMDADVCLCNCCIR